MRREVAGVLHFAQDDWLEAVLRSWARRLVAESEAGMESEAGVGFGESRMQMGLALWVEQEFVAWGVGRARGSGSRGWR